MAKQKNLILTRKVLKAIKELVDLGEQVLDRGGYIKGDWQELEDALDLLGPLVYPDYESCLAND